MTPLFGPKPAPRGVPFGPGYGEQAQGQGVWGQPGAGHHPYTVGSWSPPAAGGFGQWPQMPGGYAVSQAPPAFGPGFGGPGGFIQPAWGFAPPAGQPGHPMSTFPQPALPARPRIY